MAQPQPRDIHVGKYIFPCPVSATVKQAENRIRSRYGLQFGGLEDQNGALINTNARIGLAVGTISFVGGRPIIQGLP